MNFTRFHFEELSSTSDEAAARARAGAPAGTVVTALRQTAGRGRQGRTWQSPSGNLYASILLRSHASPESCAQISFVAGLAVGESIGSTGLPWSLKWPNDILVGGAKISGLLLERESGWIVAGIGVNIATVPDVPDRPVTSLYQQGVKNVTPDAFLDVLLARLESWIGKWEQEGFLPVREAWLAHAYGLGKPVRVTLAGGQEKSGTFEKIDESGALLLVQPDRTTERILAGDVFFHD